MKILYLSCHSILEEQEVKMFVELGHEVFSLHGAYQNGQGDGKRPPINMPLYPHLQDVAIQCSRENIHQEIIDWCDVVICMHRTDWIKDNMEKMTGKKVVLRTIGQNTEANERDIAPLKGKGVKIVRMSKTEETIPGYQGKNALIYFGKDEEEYNNWTGNVPHVVGISQALFGNESVSSRGDHMNRDVFTSVMNGFDWKIFGPDNENAKEHNGGLLSFADLKTMLRFNRVFFYTGTEPSPYTLGFIEAMMTGIPVVSIGPKLFAKNYPNQKTFEIPDIIENGRTGYYSDSVNDLREYIQTLLTDYDKAKMISANGRTAAIQYFGKSKVKMQWKNFLDSL